MKRRPAPGGSHRVTLLEVVQHFTINPVGSRSFALFGTRDSWKCSHVRAPSWHQRPTMDASFQRNFRAEIMSE
jgi:hypothetical protein